MFVTGESRLPGRLGLRVLAVGRGEKVHKPVPHPRWRKLKCYAVVYVVSGAGVFHQGTETFDVPAGSAFFLFPDIAHHYGPREGGRWAELFFVFDGAVADRLLEQGLMNPSSPVLNTGLDNSIVAPWNEAISLADSAPPGHDAELTGALFTILCRLFRHGATALPDRKTELAEAIAEAMKTDVKRTFFNLREFSEELGVSYSYARRVFRDVTGYSPVQFFTLLKIHEAREALVGTQHTIHDISAGLGFGDQHYFSRTFKRLTGLSPTEYRDSFEHWHGSNYWQEWEGVKTRQSRKE